MKTKEWILGLAGALLIALTTMASAETIYEHDLISQSENLGFSSNIDGALSADNFNIESDFLIQSITWSGMYSSGKPDATDSFDIRIYNLLGVQLFAALGITSVTNTAPTVTDVEGNIIYVYELTLSSGWEIAGGEYLISISNLNSSFSDWLWADGTGGDGMTYYVESLNSLESPDSEGWVTENYYVDLAFSLDGEPAQTPPVPEPSTILLFGLGLLVTAFSGRAGRHI